MGGDRGHAALELILVVSLLLIPATTMLATVPGWIERQAAARDAAAGAARAAVMAGDRSTVAVMVSSAESAWGLDPGGLVWTTSGDPAGRSGVFTVEVTVELPGVELPGLGPIGGVGWTTAHSESVAAHRSRG
jgi:hypothetical protein